MKRLFDWYGRMVLALLMLLTMMPNAAAAERDTGAFYWLWGLIGCYIIFFIIWIFVMIWVYRDAESRGKSGVLWAIVIFVGGIVGLILWFVVRPPKLPGGGHYYPPPPGHPDQVPYPPPPPGYYPPPPGGGYPPPPPRKGL